MKKIPLAVLLLFLGLSFTGLDRAEAAKKEKKKPASKKTLVRAVAVPDYPDPAVAEIHQELDDILRVHQSLQVQYRDQVREIQRITDQARAHQKLLKDLETVRRVQQQAASAKALDDLVRLEKIRLIQKQTHQNRTRLEEIQKQEKEE